MATPVCNTAHLGLVVGHYCRSALRHLEYCSPQCLVFYCIEELPYHRVQLRITYKSPPHLNIKDCSYVSFIINNLDHWDSIVQKEVSKAFSEILRIWESSS